MIMFFISITKESRSLKHEIINVSYRLQYLDFILYIGIKPRPSVHITWYGDCYLLAGIVTANLTTISHLQQYQTQQLISKEVISQNVVCLGGAVIRCWTATASVGGSILGQGR